MKFSAHTNATWGYSIEEAVDLFIRQGFDGMDVGCNELSGITIELPIQKRRDISTYCKDRSFAISNLACYAGGDAGFTSEDWRVREQAIEEVKRHIALSRDLGSPMVRVFSGRDEGKGIAPGERGFDLSVQAFRRLSDHALDQGVTLLIETHPFTIACSAGQTAGLVKAIDRANVRALYDPSNLVVYARSDDVEGDFAVVKDLFSHVHVKDQVTRENGAFADTVIGRGVIPWGKILPMLQGIGYEGFLAIEYQRGKRSTPLLPDPEVGLKESLDHLKRILVNQGEGMKSHA